MGRKARRIGEEKEERQSKRGEGYSYPLSNRALQQLLFTYQQLGASIYINAQIRLPMRIYELLVKEGRGGGARAKYKCAHTRSDIARIYEYARRPATVRTGSIR